MPTSQNITLKFALVVLLAGIAFGTYLLYAVFGPNTGKTSKNSYLYLNTAGNYEQALQKLSDGKYVKNISTFRFVAKAMKLPHKIKPGRYHVKPGMSNFQLVRMLRSGNQVPLRLVINKLRTKQNLAHLLSTNLEADSTEIIKLLNNNSFLVTLGFDTNTAMAMVIPDTYEFFWNTSAEKALKKLTWHYNRFWNETRKQQAAAHGVSPIQAVIVASIVDEETNIAEDKPNIASVYLNRLRIGMRLQADPTIKFGIGDFSIRRITGKMLEYESPYNTYKYAGLPPGPICTPSHSSINAVLEAPKTAYLYFCAKADFSGRTAFAKTLNEQINNARAYHRALNARGIR